MSKVLEQLSGKPSFIWMLVAVVAAMIPIGATAQSDVYASEIRELAERAVIQRAFRAIDDLDATTVANHITLTEIPAPPFMEDQRAARFAEMLRDAGADSVWIDEIGNVLALRRGRPGGRTVAVDAHLDTVFPEGTDVTVRTIGDTLFAPGIGDDTRGLSIVVTMLRALNTVEVRTQDDILFIGTVGEEGLGDLRGMKHLFRDGGPRIDTWISIDGVDPSHVVHRGLGSHRYRVTIQGPGGHSWGAFGLGNPHHALGLAIEKFVEAADPYTSEGPRTSYNVGRIGGGTSVNSIPFESWMEVDMRSVNPERLNGIDALFQRAMREGLAEANRVRRDGDSLTIDIAMIGDRPSGTTDLSAPIVQRALAAIIYFGREPDPAISSTNSNIPISLGVPGITIGSGGAEGNAHALSEWWVNDDGASGIKQALLILAAEAGLLELVR